MSDFLKQTTARSGQSNSSRCTQSPGVPTPLPVSEASVAVPGWGLPFGAWRQAVGHCH